MKKLSVAIVAISVMFGGAATAADMAVKARPAPPPVFSWTGFYVGGFVGGAWGASDSRVTDPCGPAATVVCGAVGTYNGVAPVGFDLGSSVIGGGTVGYNWQSNSF